MYLDVPGNTAELIGRKWMLHDTTQELSRHGRAGRGLVRSTVTLKEFSERYWSDNITHLTCMREWLKRTRQTMPGVQGTGYLVKSEGQTDCTKHREQYTRKPASETPFCRTTVSNTKQHRSRNLLLIIVIILYYQLILYV